MNITSILYLLIALLAFSILIIVHELGHFIVAKLNNVKVEEFSIGMGPKIFGIHWKETEYCLRAILFGGYVRMMGEQADDTETNNEPRAFSNKKPIQRLSITIAGPIMNIITAIVFFALIAGLDGVSIPIISKIENNSPAYTEDIRVGDKIVKINNENINSWDAFYSAVNKNKKKTLTIVLNRNDQLINKTITPMFIKNENRYIVGIYPSNKKLGFIQSVKYGFNESATLVKETFSFLGSLFKGNVSANTVGGPVSVLRISTKAAQNGIFTLLLICAYISIQLAIFNLIPFPALDGGWIFLSIIEMIIGRKINNKIVNGFNYVGFLLLFTLLIVVTIKDILFPIQF